ncbi:dihydrolipoyllysine acetyltransferase [Jeotgalibacillus proteolyticus]|uniref:Dihydrolipoamide acetyltransferase component of pyruvate dehydrogenase complex n=1 Tax=Jeotgalibacillus proteolyticus TaxID=2082395 RepID=A0A2S5GHV7_9BACL|nr:dihydrolipoyllysine acetyltransferase [Jeotgalibacillus proteolyticus]
MEVKLHDIGEGMTQADINHYFVKPGDRVKADDPLVEVQTDKMTAEIPSPTAGTVKQIVAEIGATIAVGTTILLIDSEMEELTESKTKSRQDEKKPDAGLSTAKTENTFTYKRILASPYTRKLARDNGIQIESIKGTGPSNRIMDEDIYAAIKTTMPVQEEKPQEPAVKSTSISYKGIRKQIGRKMAESLMTIPHCTHFEEIDVTEMAAMREALKSKGTSLSANVFFIKALSICLQEFPIFNSSLNEKEEVITLHETIHIGMATNTDEGLIVPVLRNANKKSFKQLQEDCKKLTQKALSHSLSLEEIKGSTFTISNVGPLGGSIGATPIINPPEAGLMAFHKTKKRPMVNNRDEIVIRQMMNISFSYDHRIIDGGSAVAFTNRFAELIEEPAILLMELS